MADEEEGARWESTWLQSGFTQIPNVVIRMGLSPSGQQLYILLAHFAWQDSKCWPGQDGLAALMGATERTVRRARKELEEAGLLQTKRRGLGKSNVYILLSPDKITLPDRTSMSGQERTSVSGQEEDAVEEELKPTPADKIDTWLPLRNKAIDLYQDRAGTLDPATMRVLLGAVKKAHTRKTPDRTILAAVKQLAIDRQFPGYLNQQLEAYEAMGGYCALKEERGIATTYATAEDLKWCGCKRCLTLLAKKFPDV